jgi:hypothetical protein
MTTKPKPRKAPPAETGINPKLAAIAAKLDEAYARVTTMHRDDDDTLAADSARETCCGEIGILGRKLARVRATNIEEMKLKSRYTDPLDWHHIETPWPNRSSVTLSHSIRRAGSTCLNYWRRRNAKPAGSTPGTQPGKRPGS